MKTKIIELAKICKEAIESEARESYKNGDNAHRFNGCYCSIKQDDSCVEICCHEDGTHEVLINRKFLEYGNTERAIEEWLDANADEVRAWQDEYDSDPWRDVDEGCDPAFPHYGDFERWAYGY